MLKSRFIHPELAKAAVESPPVVPVSSERFERQSGFVFRERMPQTPVPIIGVGAVGRNLAIQLAALGVPKLRLVDFDYVDLPNVTTQGYSMADLGKFKVDALAEEISRTTPDVEVYVVVDRFRPKYVEDATAVFCGVDSIATRKRIWEQLPPTVEFWSDARMLGEVLYALTVDQSTACREYYASTLFDPAEAERGRCTASGCIYTAAIAAGLEVHQFTRWLRGIPVTPHAGFNLVSGEWIVIKSEHDLAA